jgi:aspartyl protease family protein
MEQDQNPYRHSGITMLVIAWLLVFGMVYWYFGGWEQRQFNPNPQALVQQQSGELVLQRNRDGHYIADGKINGAKVTFLLDTGATQVALPSQLARRLGLKLGAALTLHTANGNVVGYQTRLANVSLGPIELHDVSAVVSDGMDSQTVLLGMSFLRRLEFTQRNEHLILRQSASSTVR